MANSSLGAWRIPALLSIGGVVVAIAAALGRVFETVDPASDVVNLSALTLGVALAGAGALQFAFQIAGRRSYEWLIAWRYLSGGSSSKSWILAALGVLSMVVGVDVLVGFSHDPLVKLVYDLWGRQGVNILPGVAAALCVVGLLALLFGVLHSVISVFASVSVFGVMLGTTLLVVVLSVMGGFEEDLKRKILGTLSHAIVTHPAGEFDDYAPKLRDLEQMPGVVALSPYLESEVMMASEINHSGVVLRGINPSRFSQVTEIRSFLASKRGSGKLDHLVHPEELSRIPDIPFTLPKTGLEKKQKKQAIVSKPLGQGVLGRLKPDESLTEALNESVAKRKVFPGVILGAELANNLRVYVGDDVTLVAPLGGMSPVGPVPKARQFRVAGIFYSGMYEYDTKFAYVLLGQAQRLLGTGDQITGIELRSHSTDAAIGMAETLRATLPKTLEVQDWKQLNSSLFSALKLERVVMFLFLVFVVGVASLSIVTTLIMVVLQKGREVAILKALGATRQAVLRIFVCAGVYIGVLGTFLGMFLGVTACLLLGKVGLPLDPEVYYISQLPVQMELHDIAMVGVSAVLLALLATLYPATMAVRLLPVDGLRWQA